MPYNVGGLLLERPFRIRRIGHFGFHSPDILGTVDFLTRRLGLIVTDEDDFSKRVPELKPPHNTGWFLRCGSDHHTLVLGSQQLVDTREPARRGAVVGQISWQVGSLEEVINGIPFLEGRAKPRRVGRDTPGSNWHSYFYDPDGYINELFYGMEQVGWDGRSKPESMYGRGFTTLPPLPQIPEFREVDDALAQGQAAGGYRWHEKAPLAHVVEGIQMPQPFKLTRLGRIMLFVADIQASLAFYTGALGLKLTERVKLRGHEVAYLRAGPEHHTLTLVSKPLQGQFAALADLGAGYAFAMATYAQLRAAHQHLLQQGYEPLDIPAELSAGVHHGFWLRGPDRLAVQLYYGMDRVQRDGSAPVPTAFPTPVAQWPETLADADAAWDEPVFLGPLA